MCVQSVFLKIDAELIVWTGFLTKAIYTVKLILIVIITVRKGFSRNLTQCVLLSLSLA